MPLPRTTLEGNAVTDVTLRFIPSGKAVANFRMACNSRKLNPSTQQWEDGDSLFLTINCWEQLGENVAESVKSGDPVIVTGDISMREYEHDGAKRQSLEVRAYSVALALRTRVATSKKVDRQAGTESRPPARVLASVPNDPWGGTEDPPPF